MFKKIGFFIFGLILMVNISGCLAVAAGAAGGAGTATWLAGKITKEVAATFDHSVKAAESGLKSLNFPIVKQTVKYDVAQFISKYTDGKTIWVDVKRVSQKHTTIEVRVGAVKSDNEAERKIMDRILRYL
ncbi:MAG: DUF3568 family protein [Candidatus Omnitrophota bacterium]